MRGFKRATDIWLQHLHESPRMYSLYLCGCPRVTSSSWSIYQVSCSQYKKSLLSEKQRVNWALLENKGRYSACTRWAGEKEREAISVNGDGWQCLASVYLFLLFLLLLFLWYCSIWRQRMCRKKKKKKPNPRLTWLNSEKEIYCCTVQWWVVHWSKQNFREISIMPCILLRLSIWKPTLA